jgi:hypothetical protein
MNATAPKTVEIDGATYRTGTIDGILHVFETCDRCGGSGQYPSPAWQGVCLGCNGKGGKWAKYDNVIKRAARNAAAAKRADAKSAAKAVAAASASAAFLASKPADEVALVQASEHHIAQDILSKLNTYGSVSEAQWALALKVSTEAIERAAAHAAAQASAQAAGHLGNIGDKVELDVTVTRVSSFETQSFNGFSMETKYVIAMVTAQGHELNTFTNGAFVDVAEEGAQLRIKATVKSHGDYQGKPQTTLIRVKAV